ncbi:MAG: hypothetical protein ACI4M3_03640 [Acutalibacteraceae bacterium]
MSKVFSAKMFFLDLYKQLKSIIIWLVITVLVVLGAGSLFYALETSGVPDLMREMMTALPEELLNAVDLNMLPDFSEHNAVFGIMCQWLLVLTTIYAGYLGAAAIVRFSCDSSVNFLIAQPISRAALVITRYFSQLFSVILYNALLYVVLVIYGNVIGVSDVASLALSVSGVFLLVEFLCYSIGFLISNALHTLSSAASFGFGFFIFTFAIACICRLMPHLEFGLYLCPYEYFSVYSMCMGGYEFPVITAILTAVVSLAFFAGSAVIFIQTDIKDH